MSMLSTDLKVSSDILTNPNYNTDLTRTHLPAELQRLRNVYVRNAKFELVKRNSDGTETIINDPFDFPPNVTDPNVQKTIPLKYKSDQLVEYFTNCLNGSNVDINNCSKFLAMSDFYEQSVQAVDNMDPGLALKILQAYGFKVEKGYDSPNRAFTFNRMMSVNDWLQNVVGSLPDENAKKSILSNQNLKWFLCCLVDKLDQNPAILNPTYKGEPMRRMQYNGRIASLLPPMPTLSNRVRGLYAANVALPSQILAIMFGNSNFRPFLRGGSTQTGGNGAVVVPAPGALSFNAKDLYTNSAAVFRSVFLNLHASLKRMGKDINKTDEDRIFQLLDELSDREKILNNSLGLIEKYLNALNNGLNDDSASATLKLMEQQVANRDKAYRGATKRQGLIVSVCNAMGSALYDNARPMSMAMPLM